VQRRVITIAVIDDHEAVLDAIRLVLEEQHWAVRTYASGEAFLADLEALCVPDCVILDPHLPGISGSEVAKSIALHDRRVPIIGLTAHPNSPVTAAVSEAGARGLLTKPVTSQQLVENVLAAITSSSA
jgi:two-component system, LuxR family, response regulator DctR